MIREDDLVKTKLAKLDALTLRLEFKWWSIGPHQPYIHYFCQVHPVLDINNNANNQKQHWNSGFIMSGSKNRTKHKYTSSIPNYSMYNITLSHHPPEHDMCNRTISGQHTPKWNSREVLPQVNIKSFQNNFEWKLVTLFTFTRRDWVCFSQVTASICKIQCKELKYANVFRVFSIFTKYLWNLSRL